MWILSVTFLPVISCAMWLGMLLTMFIYWEVHGHKHFPSMAPDQRIAYISDIGAFKLKPLFITGSAVTTSFLNASLLSERYLRHTGRLTRNDTLAEKILSTLSIIAAFAGMIGLILLSIFDTYHHHTLHDCLLCVFIAGYILSAVFICAEYQRLGIRHRSHRILRISFWIKLAFILIEVVLAIAFGTLTKVKKTTQAAALEWIIALIYSGYVASFVVDLLPSVRTSRHVPQGWKDREEAMEIGRAHNAL